ncbi:MAG: glycosyltransferase [Acidimicrobiales bacterium]
MRRRILAGLRAAGRSKLAADGGLWLFGAMMAVNVVNFGFHMIMSRLLGAAVYGALGSLLGLVLVLGVVTGALQVAVTQAVAEHGGRPGSVEVRRPLWRAGLAGLVGFAAFAGAAPAIDGFLHFSSAVPALWLGAFVSLGIVGLVLQGVLIGELRFRAVAVAMLAGGAARLVSGLVLVAIGFGLDGAIAASAINAGVTCAILLWSLRYQLRPGRGLPVLGLRLRSTMASVVALGGFSVYTSIDSILARHYLPPVLAGNYVAAATAARIALFLPGAVAMIAFPRLVASTDAIEDRRLLTHALGLVGLLAGFAALVMLVVPGLVVTVLFGSTYVFAAHVLGILGVSAAGMALVSLLAYVHLARRSVLASATWAGVVTATVLIAAFHGALSELAWSMLAVSIALLAVMLAPVMARSMRADRGRGEDSGLEDLSTSGELWAAIEPELDVSVVVPYYNPGQRLRPNVDALIETLTGTGATFEVIAVSDGSTDGSEETLGGLPPCVRSVKLGRNSGKGEALRVGLAMGRGAYIGFIDADGDLPAEQLGGFMSIACAESPDVVVGSKRHPASQVVYPPLRRLYSWGYQQVVRVLFHLNVRDTQTGLKLIRREVLAAVLPRMVEKRFAFDLELLVVARRLGYTSVLEAPVRIRERFGSTVSAATVWGMLVDTLAISYRLRVLRYYDRAHPFVSVQPPVVPVRSGVTAVGLDVVRDMAR